MNDMHWWDYTSNEIRDMPKDKVIIQPIASVEQHGPHLPVATDSLIVSAFARQLEERFQKEGYPALFLPLLPYGKSNEHTDFPGTIVMGAHTLMDVLMEVGQSVARAGFTKLVFLNGHGGNHELLDMMTREVRIVTGLMVFAVHPLLKIQPEEGVAALSPEEARHGIHAGLVETAILMHIAPGLVRMDRLQAEFPVNFEECEYLDFTEKVPFGWMTRDVCESGTLGDPTKATAKEGELWLTKVTDVLCKVFRDILKYQPA